jgi:hypothetical protein
LTDVTESGQPVPGAPSQKFADRSFRLKAAGAICAFLGAGSFLMALLSIFPLVFAKIAEGQAAIASPKMIAPAVGLYTFIGIFFLIAGIGTIRLRRWARNLMIVVAWGWLVIGVLSMVGWVLFLPRFTAILEDVNNSPGAVRIAVIFVSAMMFVLYVLIPAVLVLLYRGRDARLTCEHYNSELSWTDRCPLQVLGVSVTLACGALSLLTTVAYGCIVPFFGILLHGVAGFIVVLAVMLILSWLTVETYRMRMRGWWGTVLFSVLGAFSVAVTFFFVDMREYYRLMDIPDSQMEMLARYDIMAEPMVWVGMTAVFLFAWLGYLVYVRKYFKRGPANGADAPPLPEG